ncbi:putative Rhodanese-like protein [Magnetofaba australis IT-1]|uniref:Putative Rhodanese-like protein n=1 Tax=Magnetofaba australis IT-1 TaxID=1434232 RepID=A0A1Y2K772_9PROT|nr:putative Rhodanese-like protein [Magnetofaba australis IT-1]
MLLLALALIAPLTPVWASDDADVPDGDIPQSVDEATTIDAAAAYALWQKGVAFVDVRKDARWATGHIPNATHLYLDKGFSAESLAQVAQPDQEVVIYCDRGVLSSVAVETAVFWDYAKLYYFRNGMHAWSAAGYPVEK